MGIKTTTMAKKTTLKKKAKPAVKKAAKKAMPTLPTGQAGGRQAVAKPKPAPKKKVVKKIAKPKPVKKTVAKKAMPTHASRQAGGRQVAVKKASVKAKPILKKVVVTKPVVKIQHKKVVAKKPVVKAKPKKAVAKKPIIKNVQVKKAMPTGRQVVSKKPVKKVKPAPKKVSVKKPIVKKVVQVKKAIPIKKVVPVKKVVPIKKTVPVKKELPKVKEIPVKPIQKEVEKPAPPKYIHRPKIVPMKNMQKFEANYNRADMFYKNVLKAEIVKRYSPTKDEYADFIAKDQNLTIKIADKESTISEKARDQDWNDIYVEIFRKYPDEDGWIRYTEAEYIAYFFPGRVFWARMEPIRQLCFDILTKAIDSGIYKELSYMYPKNSGRLSKTFKINQKTYSFNFIQTYHEEGENSYCSIGISLPFVLLMDFRIDYKIFKQ